MREQLIRYVDLLFAGAPNAQDVKQEILQNTLDRYDDLLQQGKSPEAAYSLAISGIVMDAASSSASRSRSAWVRYLVCVLYHASKTSFRIRIQVSTSKVSM